MKERLLRVIGPNFVAGALWIKTESDVWICKEAAPIIRWMIGGNPAYAKWQLERRGLKHEWLSPSQEALKDG
jgi:hypothetical protein